MIGLILTLAMGVARDGAPPVTAKYRIEQRLESRVDLSGFGQGERVQSQRFVWFTTLTYRDSAGGQVFHAVLDSLEIDLGSVPVPPGSVDSARRAEFHGFLNSWGRMTKVSTTPKSTFTAVFESQLHGLHPRRKPGAKAGEQWTDTLTVDTKTGRGETTHVTTITTFTQGGAERHAGRPALRLGATFTVTTSGTVETPGGPAGLEGTGRGTSTYFTREDGRLLGATSTTSGEGSVNVTAAPTPIGLKTSSTTIITLLHE